ncbi:MAG: hypothetical protein AAF223_00245 [Bacteroidota bacterium]
MKTLKISIICGLLGLVSTSLSAQNKITQYIADHLLITYVNEPNEGRKASYTLDSQEIYDDEFETESGDFWYSPEAEEARELVLGLLSTPENGGDRKLQRYVYGILKIRNKTIWVRIYNDGIAPISEISKKAYKMCLDDDQLAWPCASRNGDDASVGGIVHLGTTHLNIEGIRWTKSTFLHELMHTQDRSKNGGHRFYSTITNKGYKYGNDGSHYTNEAVPSLYSSYKEGIANTLEMMYDYSIFEEQFEWFATNGDLLVEKNKDSKATDLHKDVWLYDRIKAEVGAGKAVANMPAYRSYAIRDLPSRYIIHNEMIMAMMLSQYVTYVGQRRLVTGLKKVNKSAEKNPRQAIAILIEKMCELGLPEDYTLEDIYMMGHEYPKVYLLPLAYADYFTGYHSDSKEEFAAIFGSKVQEEWIDMYWDVERDVVLYELPEGEPSRSDLTDIAIALQITSSEDESK